MFLWEGIAVIFGTMYLLFAMRENAWAWVAGFISTAIFSVLFFHTHLYMESVLQLYYVAMAVYGWHQWHRQPLKISSWNSREHLSIMSLIILLSALSSIILNRYTNANFVFLDSLITWGSFIATFMATRKILENWLYWIVLDSMAIYCYLNKALYFTAGLYSLYVVLATLGFIQWSIVSPNSCNTRH